MTDDTMTIEFNAKSTPFASDPPNVAPFYEALGRTLYLWGRFESHLQMTILAIWNLPEAESLHAKFRDEIPVSMKKRAEFWKTAFKQLDILKPWQASALKLMADAMEGARQRSILLHGAWSGFTATDPLTADNTIYRHRGDLLLIEGYKISHPKLIEMAEDFDDLNTRLVPLTWNLACLSSREADPESS